MKKQKTRSKDKVSKKNISAINPVQKRSIFLPIIKMSEKTIKLDNIVVNKKEFHKSKQPINLNLVNVDQIIISHKFKHNDDGFKYFIGYKEYDIVIPLCIILL